MTPSVAADFAAAFGSFIKASTKLEQPIVCLGRDSRPSGEMLAAAAISGLAAVGCRVIELGVVTTPSVAVMITKHGAAGGMAITASHNPIMWNGLKCLNADGVAPPPADAREIIRRFQAKDFQYAAVERIPPITRDHSSNETHVNKVLAQVDVKAIRLAKFKVVLDSVNGAGCVSGRMLLDALGCDVVHLNGEPTGFFAHTPEPIEENLRELAARTKFENASCGFAQDPDADRLAIIDDGGTFIGEEYTLVLAAKRMLEREIVGRRGSGTGIGGQDISALHWAVETQNIPVLATNLSTSRMIDDLAAAHQTRVVRTAVGEAHVVAAMKQHGQQALLGGEGNGGVILPQVCWVRDSLSAMALTLELLALSRSRLSMVIESLPRYAMIKHKFDLAKIGGLDAVKASIERVVKKFAHERVITVDGVRIDFADGWVHLRSSNTEPIARLIGEARSESRAWQLIDEVAAAAGMK